MLFEGYCIIVCSGLFPGWFVCEVDSSAYVNLNRPIICVCKTLLIYRYLYYRIKGLVNVYLANLNDTNFDY